MTQNMLWYMDYKIIVLKYLRNASYDKVLHIFISLTHFFIRYFQNLKKLN